MVSVFVIPYFLFHEHPLVGISFLDTSLGDWEEHNGLIESAAVDKGIQTSTASSRQDSTSGSANLSYISLHTQEASPKEAEASFDVATNFVIDRPRSFVIHDDPSLGLPAFIAT